ncbi:hypothetical protein JMN32_01265 [Fulvivirga sp. 29W222]|uniref:Uncharacterized protein n=1 Tax=Fulvivirga marina TaxID=2494733 RepID=A0A937KC63_9BACT|nr:hypothetical protein [Fulvivirga marina]MBL6444918.1 hypothetical protein [Fulvivirga marina]
MAKRQLRIPTNNIPQKWPEISGKKANIVLSNGSVLMATLLNLQNDSLEIKNMRLTRQVLPLNGISEIIIDY